MFECYFMFHYSINSDLVYGTHPGDNYVIVVLIKIEVASERISNFLVLLSISSTTDILYSIFRLLHNAFFWIFEWYHVFYYFVLK